MALKESSPPRLEPDVPPDGRGRAPWTRVLALGAGAFALWFLLFAPTLQHNAQVSPVGTRRTASLDLVGPVAALSRGLQLSHLVSATGREQSLPGGPGRRVVRVVRVDYRPRGHEPVRPAGQALLTARGGNEVRELEPAAERRYGPDEVEARGAAGPHR